MSQDKNEEKIDLSRVLKVSDSNIKLESSRRDFYPETPKIIQWLIKYSGGFVKNEKQASYLLLGFVMVAVIISLFLLFGVKGNVEIKENSSPSFQNLYP